MSGTKVEKDTCPGHGKSRCTRYCYDLILHPLPQYLNRASGGEYPGGTSWNRAAGVYQSHLS